MHRFLLKNLFLNSLLAFAIVSCSPGHGYKLVRSAVITEINVRPVINRNNSLLYKAKINLYNRYYSGLIVLKQTDQSTSHLTFVTEIGMKMFDFEIRDNTFKLMYVFEPLNKPKIMKLLESDMKLILLQHLLNKEAAVYEKKNEEVFIIKENFRYYYKVNMNNHTVEKIISKGVLFTKEKVNYFYNDSLDASQIRLRHKGLIRLKIELNKLNKAAP
jgi:hypothetical protein